MGRLLLIGRLAVRDIRHRPAESALALLAIGAATAVLTLGLILHGVTGNPYQATRAATRGPDLVAEGPGVSQAAGVTHIAGVTASSGPFPATAAALSTGRYTGIAMVQGRTETANAAVDQPAVTAGTWVRPGGVVLERAFATSLGVGVGDRITLNYKRFTIAGLAVSAAWPPYPELCETGCVIGGPEQSVPAANAPDLNGRPGVVWATESDVRSISSYFGLNYVVNVTLKNPATAASIVNGGGREFQANLTSGQAISTADALLVADEQTVLQVGTFLIVLLALASVALLAGGRMIEQTRRVGLLKAAGGTPDLVAGVLLAEHMAIALAAAGAGLLAGWLTAPVLSSPGAGLIGAPSAPSLTLGVAGLVLAVALGVALLATLVPAIRAARTSTVSALAAASSGRAWRHGRLIALSTRLPVALLIGLRLAARRPRRSLLTMASAAVTTTAATTVLVFHSTASLGYVSQQGIANPIIQRDSEALLVTTVVLIVLAVVNAVFTGWVTAVDARHSAALIQALGATPRQLLQAQAAAQGIAALPGVIAGVPLGIALYAAASHAHTISLPSAGLLALAALGILAAVAALAMVPARAVARGSISGVLQAELA